MPSCIGKTALVTGASRGIGKATAVALAKAGAQVLVHYGRGFDEAHAIAAEVQGLGGRVQAVGADLSAAICDEFGIEHRLTKPNHPWTNGQVERMNSTLKDATVKRYHYESHDQLRAHLQLFLDGYNHARRLKTLRGLTTYEHILHVWTKEPERFRLNPSHHIPGPST